MKRIYLSLLIICMVLSGCVSQRINELAGRHWIKHPETGEKLWAPHSITEDSWDAENKVWRYSDGEICGDGYLYDGEGE